MIDPSGSAMSKVLVFQESGILHLQDLVKSFTKTFITDLALGREAIISSKI